MLWHGRTFGPFGRKNPEQLTGEHLVEFLQVSLCNESFNVALSNVELAVLRQIDSSVMLVSGW